MARAAKKKYQKRLPSEAQAKKFINCPPFFAWVVARARQAIHRDRLPETLRGYPDHFLGVVLARHVHQTLTSAGFGDAVRDVFQKHYFLEFGVTIVGKSRLRDVDAVRQINELLAQRVGQGISQYYPDPHWTAFMTALEVEPFYVSTATQWISGQWYLLPPALKFVLIGGADAVEAIGGDQKVIVSIQEFARIYGYVGTKAAEELNPFPESTPITRGQVEYALRQANKLKPLENWWALKTDFVLPTSFGGFHRHHSGRGQYKRDK